MVACLACDIGEGRLRSRSAIKSTGPESSGIMVAKGGIWVIRTQHFDCSMKELGQRASTPGASKGGMILIGFHAQNVAFSEPSEGLSRDCCSTGNMQSAHLGPSTSWWAFMQSKNTWAKGWGLLGAAKGVWVLAWGVRGDPLGSLRDPWGDSLGGLRESWLEGGGRCTDPCKLAKVQWMICMDSDAYARGLPHGSILHGSVPGTKRHMQQMHA